MNDNNFIEFPFIPITEETFKRQGWEKIEEIGIDEDGEELKFYYWVLPLPKDNPDEFAGTLLSTANDEWEDYELNEGEYMVSIADFFNLGNCRNEEELEILYRILTKENIED